MKQLTGHQTRQMFLDFFASKNHMIEPGASLVPINDPTLLWINAGVAALKKYFDGTETPANNRIANAQKSIRTNDIENVGKTARHHTFFEMLGNFSIGDYFKEDAIPFAWEFLTSDEWIGMDKEKLYITVYTDDEDAYNIWVNKCGVNPSHILKTYENFWEIGKGPGGPDSEIFYDRGEKYDPEGLGEKLFFEELENDRYVEVWNIVFSQYDCDPDIDRKDYKELPHKNIDTGMGLERLVSIIQGGETNFDTDLFLPIIHATEALATVSYEDNKMAYRVIADHIRTITFALSDGALFDKAGRGYVLRRILRRAVRYGKKIGIENAFLYTLVDVVADTMEEYYGYLKEKIDFVKKSVKKEEEAFSKTLIQGEKLMRSIMNQSENKMINGKDAFALYDTYGFPLELTVEIAEESGFTVDEEGFKEEMRLQQERARAARGDDQSMGSQKIDLMEFETESLYTYDTSIRESKVIGLFKDGEKVDVLTDSGEVVFDITPFYAEMGGQRADTGLISNDTLKAEVTNVLRAPHGQHLHFVTITEGDIHVGDTCTLSIDLSRRADVQKNHTATHLLDAALKEILGEHCSQAGSYVGNDRLRFDFTHPEKVSDEDLTRIENLVNEKIFEGITVVTEELPKEEAFKKGAVALFGEKYGDTVRVVEVSDFSMEFCGGTHVSNTSEIGLFKIDSESSVGSGIRRIEALTGQYAYQSLKHEEEVNKTLASLLKLKDRRKLIDKVQDINDQLSASLKEINKLQTKINALEAKASMNNIETVNGIQFLHIQDSKSPKDAKQLVFDYRDQLQSGIVVLTNTFKEKNSYFVGVSKDLTNTYKAGVLIQVLNKELNGRGGGKPDIAQGGCDSFEQLEKAITRLKESL